MIRLAFMGLRHGHIFSLHSHASKHPGVEIAGICEEDEATRREVEKAGTVRITHDSFDRLLDETGCQAVAIGDYYGRRGALAIKALERGLHVISDKPLCTSLAEQAKIEALAARRGLQVGCQLDMRDSGLFQQVRALIRDGRIGEVHGIAFGGQHPLMLGRRPAWYFEEGKHGGTINDIGIHAFDLIPWVTGLAFAEVVSARSWNAFATDFPHMKDAGQFMLRMSNGCGVLGDVSYFMPNSAGYALPQYWRMTFFGRQGIIEASPKVGTVSIVVDGDKEPATLPPLPGTPGGYLDAFLRAIGGESEGLSPSTADVLRASRTALTVQEAGDTGRTYVPLG